MNDIADITKDLYVSNKHRFNSEVQKAMKKKCRSLIIERDEPHSSSSAYVRVIDLVSFFGLYLKESEIDQGFDLFIHYLNELAITHEITGTLKEPFIFEILNYMDPCKEKLFAICTYFAINNKEDAFAKARYGPLFFKEGHLPQTLESDIFKQFLFDKQFDIDFAEVIE